MKGDLRDYSEEIVSFLFHKGEKRLRREAFACRRLIAFRAVGDDFVIIPP